MNQQRQPRLSIKKYAIHKRFHGLTMEDRRRAESFKSNLRKLMMIYSAADWTDDIELADDIEEELITQLGLLYDLTKERRIPMPISKAFLLSIVITHFASVLMTNYED